MIMRLTQLSLLSKLTTTFFELLVPKTSPLSDLGRLLEDGGYRRLESGGYRLLEDGTTGYPVEWLTADGNYFATADGVNFGVPA